MVWGIVEAGIAVIASCLPSLRPLFSGEKSAESLLASLRQRLSRAHKRSQSSFGSDVIHSAVQPTQDVRDGIYEMKRSEHRHPYTQMNSISGGVSTEDGISERKILVQRD